MVERNLYFLGVAVGLIIAWVTSVIAYVKLNGGQTATVLGHQINVQTSLIVLELVLSAAFILLAY